MDLKEGEISFEVEKPFEYFSKENRASQKCKSVLLREPTGQHARYYRKLKQMIAKAEMDIAKTFMDFIKPESDSISGKSTDNFLQKAQQVAENQEQAEKETSRDAEGLLTAIEQANRVELDDFIDVFSNMLCAKTDKSLAACNGVDEFKREHWNLMHPDDQIEMAVYWCSFFVTPSKRGQVGSNQRSQSHTSVKAQSDIKQL